jgi:hypothetical protein
VTNPNNSSERFFQDCPWLQQNSASNESSAWFSTQAEEFKRLVIANEKAGGELALSGGNLDPLLLIQLRLDMLIERIFPSGLQDRLDFEVQWQVRIGEIFQEAIQYVQEQRRQQQKPKLVLPDSPFLTGEQPVVPRTDPEMRKLRDKSKKRHSVNRNNKKKEDE